jgi:hypothetical protein
MNDTPQIQQLTTGVGKVRALLHDCVGSWLDGTLPVFFVGVNYDLAKRGIDDPLVERA